MKAWCRSAVGGATANRGSAATLDYDPAGRLWRITGPVHIRYLYDGGRIIGEATSAGAVQARYVSGPGTDETVAAYGTDLASRAWLLGDERGSVVASTSGTGAASGINTYDEYGQPASGNAGRFQYTGQAWMPEAGAYYYKARFYQPGIGRFMQTDPIGYEAGLNLYAYVGNDPVNGTDPTGTQDTNCALYDLRRSGSDL